MGSAKDPRIAVPRRERDRRLVAVLAVAVAGGSIGAVAGGSIGATAALAQVGGGTVAPGVPDVDAFSCLTRCVTFRKVTPKSRFKLVGNALENTRKISFPRQGGGWAVVKRGRFRKVTEDRVKLQVPKRVVSGPLRVRDRYGQVISTPTLLVGTPAQLEKAQAAWKFPLPGKHNYGDGFGAARSGHTHQGMDVFAPCGAQVVAVHAGKVQVSSFQGSAGNYVVLDASQSAKDFVFMHLARRLVSKGQQVSAGQLIGKNGKTGNASGCHLHFEVWKGPGWYEGGRPRDPEPFLRQWDSFS